MIIYHEYIALALTGTRRACLGQYYRLPDHQLQITQKSRATRRQEGSFELSMEEMQRIAKTARFPDGEITADASCGEQKRG
jgi:hypothetical protein